MKHNFKQELDKETEEQQHVESMSTVDELSALYREAHACETHYSFADACVLYEQILNRMPEDRAAMYRLLHCLVMDGRSSAAAVRAQRIIDVAPDDVASAEAYLVLAYVHTGEGDLANAAEFYHHARRLNPAARDSVIESKLGASLRSVGSADGKNPQAIWREGFDQVPEIWPLDDFSNKNNRKDSPFELSEPAEDVEEREKRFRAGGFFDAIESELDAKGMSIENFAQPEISFRDIGGYRDIKERLRLQFFYPIRHEQLFREYSSEAGGSVLLYGPNGCGKTLLAQAVASEVGRPMLTVSPSQIMSGAGDTGSRLKHFFDMARAQLPGVLFFDNVECLMGAEADSGLRSQFLEELDQLEKNGERLLVICATSEPWKIDSVFRRCGRFRQSMLVDVPTKSERREIIRVLARSMPLVEFDAAKVAARTDGFTGAELRAMFDAAARAALLEALRNRGETVTLTTRSLLDAAGDIRPASLSWFEKLRTHLDGAISLKGGADILPHLR